MNKAIIRCLLIFNGLLIGCMSMQKQQGSYDESSLKNFVTNSKVNREEKLRELDSILSVASKDSIVFHQTISFLQKPFSDPNSAYRDENIYIKLLQSEISSLWYDDSAKTVAREKLYLLMQNRPGNVANDFTFITPAGDKVRMHDIKTKYTLLFFYNPECEACKEMKTALINSNIINSPKGELKILAIYTDKDQKIWRDHLSEMPSTWIQGRDEDEFLYKNKVYDLRAIPTVYLLDKEKKVLLKDCVDVSLIEQIILK